MKFITKNKRETQKLARHLSGEFLKRSNPKKALVIALSGNLGAGKTTFAQGFARALSVSQNLRSPTFTLAKSYSIPNSDCTLWHIDCYRLEKPEDARTIDLPIIFKDPKALVLIEWPERIQLDTRNWDIKFSHSNSENERKISITEI